MFGQLEISVVYTNIIANQMDGKNTGHTEHTFLPELRRTQCPSASHFSFHPYILVIRLNR